MEYLRTSDLARAVGIHPNTVRLYETWGLIPPVERTPTGYRRFTRQHLDCLRLARTIYAAVYPGRGLRNAGQEIILRAVADDWEGARSQAAAYQALVQVELDHAQKAVMQLERWAQGLQSESTPGVWSIGEAAELLGASLDKLRNWERNGLICVPRNPRNGYRQYGSAEIGRLRVIRLLCQAGYSHMAILRMFLRLDAGQTADLGQVLDTPDADEDIFSAADRWLSSLLSHQEMANQVFRLIDEHISSCDSTTGV